MARNLRVSDLSPVDVERITQKAALVAAEYQRRNGRHFDEEDLLTLKILSIMAVANDLLDNDN